MYRITILTSSRADYSIYRPLLKMLQEQDTVALQIIAFGTHTSQDYGHTVDAINLDGFDIYKELPFVLDGSSPAGIANSIARTIEQFAAVWQEVSTDLIICLGDRYEMFAAVAASVPFAISVVHIHGGETTLGAMDNVFRHSLTHMSRLHFTGTELYRERVIQLIGCDQDVYNTGALSIDNLSSLSLLSIDEFDSRFKVNLSQPTILTTFHPETVSYQKNGAYAAALSTALAGLTDQFQVLITMPNADTMGNIIRQAMIELADRHKDKIFLFENLGTIGYLSAMKHCALLLGNTSSGFAEASYFPKWVINLGSRQEGRLQTANIKTIAIDSTLISSTARELVSKPVPGIGQPYGSGQAALHMTQHILSYLKQHSLSVVSS